MKSILCLIFVICCLFSAISADFNSFPELSELALNDVVLKNVDLALVADLSVDTAEPTVSPVPSPSPTLVPTMVPTLAPSAAPSVAPTALPTVAPSISPTLAPSVAPTVAPTVSPNLVPTVIPTAVPNNSPTVGPTVAPTPSPVASENDHVSVSGSFVLTGLTADDYNAKKEENDQVLVAVVVNTIQNGITANNVIINGVEDVVARRLTELWANIVKTSFSVMSNGIKILFTITIPNTKTTNFANGQVAYAAIVEALETVTSDSETFSDAVAIAAEAVGNENSFLNATITVAPVVIESSNIYPVKPAKHNLSDGQIAGLIIGILFGIILVAVIAYAFLKNRRSSYDSSKDDGAHKEVVLVDGREVMVNEGTQV